MWHILDSYKLALLEESFVQVQSLWSVHLQGDNLQRFQDDWKECLIFLGSNVPDDNLLEQLYRAQIEKSPQFKQTFALYNQATIFMQEPRSYQKLYTMVETHLLHKHLNSNARAMQTGAGIFAGKGEGKGDRHKSKLSLIHISEPTRPY